MKLSIIIPCYNEAKTVSTLLERVWACPHEPKEIILVDDFSTDGTRDVLAKRPPREGEKILFQDRNQGKGAALRRGFSEAVGDIVIVQDADLEYDPMEIPKVIRPILQDRADVVFGSRFSGGDAHRILFFWHRLANGVLTLVSNMLSDLNLTDMETCYKAFKADVLKQITIEESRFGFEPEITAKVAKLRGMRLYEVGISYYGRTYSEGKKIGWKDGVRALYCIVKYNLFR
jgi:glycosyltransferase involved in cell wall biosynthesis